VNNTKRATGSDEDSRCPALLEVIEGGDALPREADRPPYVKGLFCDRSCGTEPGEVQELGLLEFNDD
jgi:hypothetical protein